MDTGGPYFTVVEARIEIPRHWILYRDVDLMTPARCPVGSPHQPSHRQSLLLLAGIAVATALPNHFGKEALVDLQLQLQTRRDALLEGIPTLADRL
jgi:hypothetical protein